VSNEQTARRAGASCRPACRRQTERQHEPVGHHEGVREGPALAAGDRDRVTIAGEESPGRRTAAPAFAARRRGGDDEEREEQRAASVRGPARVATPATTAVTGDLLGRHVSNGLARHTLAIRPANPLSFRALERRPPRGSSQRPPRGAGSADEKRSGGPRQTFSLRERSHRQRRPARRGRLACGYPARLHRDHRDAGATRPGLTAQWCASMRRCPRDRHRGSLAGVRTLVR